MEELAQIKQEAAACTKCSLHYSRKNAVFGEGPADAGIMLIGEGPGFHENEQGRPFVGAAGQFLDELLSRIGLKRDEVYITNIVKCRPPGNRDPETAEIQACSRYLDRQIQIINPQIIVTLGRFSMAKFLPNARISEVHGRAARIAGRIIVPMYHPAAALHQPSLRPVVEEDFTRLPALMAEADPQAGVDEAVVVSDPEKNEGRQLSLF